MNYETTEMKIAAYREAADEWDTKAEQYASEGLEFAPVEAKILASNYREQADRMENERP